MTYLFQGEAEPEPEKAPVVTPQKEAVAATSPPEATQPQPVKPATTETTEVAASESNTHKKRRPAPPPPPGAGAKKESAPQENGHVQKTSVNGVAKAPQGGTKKRRAPAPPPPGGAQSPQTAPTPAQNLDLLVDGEEIPPPPTEKPPPPPEEFPPPPQEFDFVFGDGEIANSEAETVSAGIPSPGETPDSTLERKKDEEKEEEKRDAVTADDIEVNLNLAELDAGKKGNINVYFHKVTKYLVICLKYKSISPCYKHESCPNFFT